MHDPGRVVDGQRTGPLRAVILTDVPGLTASTLSAATIDAAASRPDIEVCGFVTGSPDDVLPNARQRLTRGLRRGFVALTGGPRARRRFVPIRALARRHDLPVLATGGSLSDPAFVARLHDELAPDVILSYFCVQILRPTLLDSVTQAVNYHDGLLPQYGGLAATSQSLARQEARSGYTFHRMTAEIDAGPILVRGSVPVPDDATSGSVVRAKTASAAAAVPSLLDMIVENSPGHPQSGPASYYNAADFQVLSTVSDPSALSAEEIDRRLRSCGSLTVTINGTAETVTELGRGEQGGAFSFMTADGQWLAATRIANLPAGLIAARRRLRSVLGR